jgi:SAM-dependent methyltransferase
MSIDVYKVFPQIPHPIQYPNGETGLSLLNYLREFRLDSSSANELENYLKEDFNRFVYTLNLLPKLESDASLLEIGSNPYFTSILIKKFTNYQLSCTNYFGVDNGIGKQIQTNTSTGEIFQFEYTNHNIDTDDLPFEKKFDVILFCEVLEHLTNDPLLALLRIKNSLKKDGILVLTTPNVNRLENISKMIAGSNVYDPYSGYGVYGRHNREYNKHELFLLLSHCGFEIEVMFTSDVHENRANDFFSVRKLSKLLHGIKYRSLDLGQYIFIRAKNSLPAKSCKPTWLYRSYPDSELCD